MRPLLNILLSAMLLGSTVVSAGPITYEFTANWYQGELAGTVSKGRFSFDSSRVAPAQDIQTFDLLTDFDFVLKGYHHTKATVNSGHVAFDQFGGISQIDLGTNCGLTPGGPRLESMVWHCTVDGGNKSQFYIGYYANTSNKWRAVVGDESMALSPFGVSVGTTSIRLLPAVDTKNIPEPGAAILVVSGLGLMARVRARRRGHTSGTHFS